MGSELSNLERFRMSLIVQESRCICDHANKVIDDAIDVSHKNDDIVTASHLLVEYIAGRQQVRSHAAGMKKS